MCFKIYLFSKKYKGVFKDGKERYLEKQNTNKIKQKNSASQIRVSEIDVIDIWNEIVIVIES